MEAVIAPLRGPGRHPARARRRAAAGLGPGRAAGGLRFLRVRDGARRGAALCDQGTDRCRAGGGEAFGRGRLRRALQRHAQGSGRGRAGACRRVDRSKLWTVQTPQIFRTAASARAYRGALANPARPSPTTRPWWKQTGHPVRIVLYHGINLKVTTPADWKLAEAFLRLGRRRVRARPCCCASIFTT